MPKFAMDEVHRDSDGKFAAGAGAEELKKFTIAGGHSEKRGATATKGYHLSVGGLPASIQRLSTCNSGMII